MLTNATVIGLSKTKVDKTVLSSELGIEERHDLVRSEWSWRGGGVACFVRVADVVEINLLTDFIITW